MVESSTGTSLSRPFIHKLYMVYKLDNSDFATVPLSTLTGSQSLVRQNNILQPHLYMVTLDCLGLSGIIEIANLCPLITYSFGSHWAILVSDNGAESSFPSH